MTDAQLTFYSSWASLIGLAVSIVSLVYVRSIKTNIVRFRRKQRIRQLTEDILRIQDDATPLSAASRTKLAALKRNIPVNAWSRFTSRGRASLKCIDTLIPTTSWRSKKQSMTCRRIRGMYE